MSWKLNQYRNERERRAATALWLAAGLVAWLALMGWSLERASIEWDERHQARIRCLHKAADVREAARDTGVHAEEPDCKSSPGGVPGLLFHPG